MNKNIVAGLNRSSNPSTLNKDFLRVNCKNGNMTQCDRCKDWFRADRICSTSTEFAVIQKQIGLNQCCKQCERAAVPR